MATSWSFFWPRTQDENLSFEKPAHHSPERSRQPDPTYHVCIKLTGDSIATADFVVGCLPVTIGRRSIHTAVGAPAMFLVSDKDPHRVSRRHCSIECRHGDLWAVDLTSRLGTIVNGARIGGGARCQAARLGIGNNEIQLGGANSPFRLRVFVERAER